MKSSMPSNTAHPIAELRILRDIRRDAPSKKPTTPRCYDKHNVFVAEYLRERAYLPYSSRGRYQAMILLLRADLHFSLNAFSILWTFRVV